MNSKHTIYCFLGLPASGKGTQATIFAEKHNIAKVYGIGQMVRDHITQNDTDPFLLDIKKRYDAGVPQPDEVIIDLVRNELKNTGSDIIFDNFPFSRGQAEFLIEYIKLNPIWQGPVVFHINVSPEVALKRVTARKICADCGKVYGETEEMICESCGGALVVRSDDNIETMEERLSHYQPRLKELIEVLSAAQIRVVEVNGEGAIEKIAEIIEKNV